MKTFRDLTDAATQVSLKTAFAGPEAKKLRVAGLKIADKDLSKFEKEMSKLSKNVDKTLSSIDKASGQFQSPAVKQAFKGEIKEVIRKFLSARRDSGNPISIALG